MAERSWSEDDEGPRARRDDAAARLSDALLSIRGTVRGLFGAKVEGSVLEAEGSTSQDAVVLLRQADTMLGKLRDPGLKLPAPKLAGVTVEPAGWVAMVEGPAEEVRAALQEVAKEGREAEQTQAAKSSAVAESDRQFSRGAGLLQAMLRFAALDELAERVRPSTRRPGVTAEEAPQSS